MKKAHVLAILVCLLVTVNFAIADTIRGINIDFVTIGNAGNAADTDGTPGCGAVGYDYRIGKYEVTNDQWNAFTAAAGAPTGNDGGYDQSAWMTGAQLPTNNVSWYEAAQFCNYLTSGDKSKGAYQFNGNNSNPGSFLAVNRTAAQATYGKIYVLPTEDEWYKAAYYKTDSSGYLLYANGTDNAPIAGVDSNYNNAIYAPWNVGSGTQEQNGTFDMMGNVWEWNETFAGSSCHYLRGGSFAIYDPENPDCSLRSNWMVYSNTNIECGDYGFRIVSIPEPCSLALLGLGGLALLRKK